MRKDLLHIGYKELSYEIREIVEVAEKIASFGVKISWENIGDPVAKGEGIPIWMKDIIQSATGKDEVYAYSPSKGLLKTREYLASKTPIISSEDIIFFNGLGEAINKIYGYLSFSSRVLGPNPAYPTHSSAEATNSGSEHLTYSLDPKNNWAPDIEEIENKVKFNPNIVAILVINPDNPTGAVFKREILEKIIAIAKEYNLFVIFDEIYEKLVFDKKDHVLLSDIIGEVPGISMKGISKALPWPGARCGWIEVYNQDKDKNFKKYINSIFRSKMLEVCSTTLPQYVLPEIYEHPKFESYLETRIENYKSKNKLLGQYFGDMPEVTLIKPKGAYYVSIVLNTKKLDTAYIPVIDNLELKKYINKITKNVERFDKRFCYYLLACTGICVVPLTGFNSTYEGFRMTLLEEDTETFISILKNLKKFIKSFSI